jgi:hypothetical protein
MSEWIEHDAQWYEQRLVHCACCGRLIAKNLLVADIAGERTIFCGEDCEDLYRTYVLPVRGRNYRPPAEIQIQYEQHMTK